MTIQRSITKAPHAVQLHAGLLPHRKTYLVVTFKTVDALFALPTTPSTEANLRVLVTITGVMSG